uniref:DNA-(apurinic or apyrimidinic site) endonuclease n=1 Tax=Leersia perrieri TaxID=77586 RepID=A0A0D9V6T5_9ORYZ
MPLLLRGGSLLRLFWCGCGRPSANFSCRKLAVTRLNLVMAETRATYSHRAASKNTEIKKNEELVIEKEDVSESKLEIEQIRNDPDRLQSMTVKELREITRRMGISVRGNKKDLVSAVMNSLGEEGNGKEGTSSAEKVGLSEVPSKRKGGASVVVEQHIESSEVISETPSKRSRTKNKSVKGTIREENSGTNVKQSKTSVRKEKVVGAVAKAGLGVGVDHEEPWTVLVHKKPQPAWIPYNPRVMRPPPLSKDIKALKILSWNVNGLKALLKSRGFSVHQLAQREDFDILCLQETKMQARYDFSLYFLMQYGHEKDVEVIKEGLLEGYTHSFWTCSVSKLGYSGTAIISRVKPLSIKYGLGVPDHDTEGRVVTVEFDGFYLLTAYVPNSGDGLRRLTYRVTEWDTSLGNYMKDLEKSKPVILTGDLNCAHQEIDIHDPAGNRRSAGFTNEERESFETNFLLKGFVDTFRKQHPDVVAYSYWGYRHNARKTNKGWRLDYFLVSESIAERVHDSYILPDISASDHSPLASVTQHSFDAAVFLFGNRAVEARFWRQKALEEQTKDVGKFKNLIADYDNSYWSCSVSRLGYSGTAVISRVKPISVQYGIGIHEHDHEGRVITLEFDGFYLVNTYVPNSGRFLRRLTYRVNSWDPCFSNYVKTLEKSKPVIIAGDLNCARQSIDIHNPPAKTKSAGFTIEERESFETNFSSRGLVDTFRKKHPNAVGYTFWGENQRITNKGWRLDYFLASESITDKVHDSYILPDVSFSDHSPIGLVLKL